MDPNGPVVCVRVKKEARNKPKNIPEQKNDDTIFMNKKRITIMIIQ